MINTLDSRHIARVRIPKKQMAYMNFCSSTEEDGAMVCRYCSYDRKHILIEDCTAMARYVTSVRLNHFATLVILPNRRRKLAALVKSIIEENIGDR